MEERNLETTKPLVESNDVNDKASTNEKQLPATGEQTSPSPLYGKPQPSPLGCLLTKR